jgi:hypothetical protein
MYTSTTVKHYRLKWPQGDFLGVSFDEGSHDDNWLPRQRGPLFGDFGARRPSTQRQTYRPFTNTRTQAVLAAAAPTAAPPTTARRVVRRATPATLTGVAGRPTLACAVSMESERPSFFDHSAEPKVPHARTAAAKNTRLAVTSFIESSLVARQTMLITSCSPLIYINNPWAFSGRRDASAHLPS